MEAAKEDRRSKRTRQLLGNALVELMLEKPFDEITVQDILDRADIGRSTFYAHYSDKENLLMSEIERVIYQLDAYTRAVGEQTHLLLPSLELFRHLREQHRLLQAFIWGRASDMLTRSFQGRVSKIVEHNLLALMGDTVKFSVPLSLIADFVTATFMTLLRWWLDDEMRSTPEQMDEMFQKLVMPGIHAFML
jgi:AcrR family transcriptional regulator